MVANIEGTACDKAFGGQPVILSTLMTMARWQVALDDTAMDAADAAATGGRKGGLAEGCRRRLRGYDHDTLRYIMRLKKKT